MQPRPYATAKELRHLLHMRTHPKTVVNFELEPVLASIMVSKRTLASFWNRTGSAGPSSASLPSTITSDVSETDVSNERGTAGSSGYDHETDCETESCEESEDATSREVHESGPPRK